MYLQEHNKMELNPNIILNALNLKNEIDNVASCTIKEFIQNFGVALSEKKSRKMK